MRVSVGEVRRVAALARLHLGDEEVEALAGQLADILGHIDELDDALGEMGPGGGDGDGRSADGGGVRLRADAPGVDPLDRDLEALAPGWKDGFLTVPRLRSHRDAGALDEEEP